MRNISLQLCRRAWNRTLNSIEILVRPCKACILLCQLRRDKLEQDELGMRQGKRHSAEEIVNLLPQVEVDFPHSKTSSHACKKGEIVELTCYRGRLKVDQARGLKELEQENAKLKRLVSELTLEKLVLKCFPALQGWYVFRFTVTLICLGFAASSRAQSVQLVDAPETSASLLAARTSVSDSSSSANLTGPSDLTFSLDLVQTSQYTPDTNHGDPHPKLSPNVPLDANGNPIPLNRQQPQRILGFMPNFRSVSGGTTPHPPGWIYNFQVATHQATDYSSFIFLGLTSLTAEGLNSHPVLGKGVDGFYAYTWRGFLDKTDGTYLSAWLLPSLLHEDTRYYALGDGHTVIRRALYVISREAGARTYGGRETPNIAGLGGKVLTQVISRSYYPPGAADFSVLATKFGYSIMREVAFTSIREFYPDIAAHYIRKHREKAARLAARDAAVP
jgi:hypothetical protein